MGMSYLFSKMWVWIAIGWMPKWYGQNFDDRLVWCQNTNTRRENSQRQLKCGPCECCQFESCQCPLSRNQPNECPCARHRRWVWRHHGECVCHQWRFIAMLGKGRMWMSIVFATFCLLQMVYIFTTSHHWQLWLLANRNVKIHVTFDNRLKNVSPPICLSSLSYLIAFSVQFKTELNEWVSSRQLQQTPVANTQEHHFIMTWWAIQYCSGTKQIN